MTKGKWKQMIWYILLLASTQVSVAGNYPLVVGIFGVLFLEQVNQILVLIIAMFGLSLFLPVQAMARYGMTILVAAVLLKLIQWIFKKVKTIVGALLCGISVMGMVLAGGLLGKWDMEIILTGAFESIFTAAFIFIVSPICHLTLEGRKIENKQKKVQVPIPENGERMKGYAKSFQGLSKMFSQMSAPKGNFAIEDMGNMKREVKMKICISCSQCSVCWEQVESPMQRIFERLIHSLEQIGTWDGSLHREMEEYCPYAGTVMEEAVGIFEKARLNLAWYNRLVENREVIAAQLDAMADIMEHCSKEYVDISKDNERLLRKIRYRLKEHGVILQEAHLYENIKGRMSLHIKAVSRWGNCINVKEVAKAVSQGMRQQMVPVKNSKNLVGKEEVTFVFEEEPKYHMLHGVARLAKEGEKISGDNFSYLELEQGKNVMAVSDGMGCGITACKESEMVLELIEKFLESGFSKETAIGLMNSAMVLNGGDGRYSTVDLVAVDLYTGECEFCKIGACAGFIKRGAQVEVIQTEALPAGIVPHLEMQKKTRKLRHGDFVVLMTDGVLEGLDCEEPEETMKEILETTHIQKPEKLADYILERVLMQNGGVISDDMTVLTAGIWER